MLEVAVFVCWFIPAGQPNVVESFEGCRLHERVAVIEPHERCDVVGPVALAAQMQILRYKRPEQRFRAIYWCQAVEEDS